MDSSGPGARGSTIRQWDKRRRYAWLTCWASCRWAPTSAWASRAISTLHCLPVSLAEGGAGLGTSVGIERLSELLAGAGFTAIAPVVPAPADPMNAIFTAVKP